MGTARRHLTFLAAPLREMIAALIESEPVCINVATARTKRKSGGKIVVESFSSESD